MAFLTDPFSYESEETRRKREAEEAAAKAGEVVHKQEVVTMADGSQTQKTTSEIPAPVVPEQPMVMQGPALAGPPMVQVPPPEVTVAAPVASPGRAQLAPMAPVAPVAPVAAAPAAPAAPMTPEQSNAYTAQQESGNRPGIGYHYPADASGKRASSAFGMYGITAPAYADIQRANPAFAGRPIESLTPEEQGAANQTYKAITAKQLSAFGVEPTEANLRGAHFLGAKGLADYLSTGAISPAAAAANQGEARTRQIIEQRILGRAAPASGAAQPQPGAAPGAPVAPSAEGAPAAPSPYALGGELVPSTGMRVTTPTGVVTAEGAPQGAGPTPAQTAISAYQAAQSSPVDLLKLKSDESQPEWVRQRAGDQAYNIMKQDNDKNQATKQAQELTAAAAQGDPRAANKIASSLKAQDGNWLKFVLMGFISPALQKEEAIKLGYGNKDVAVTDPTGKAGIITYNLNGKALSGINQDNTPMTENELVAMASHAANAENLKSAQTQATHAYTSAYSSLMKQRDALTQRGQTEADMASRGLDLPSIQLRAQQAGKDVITAARTGYNAPAAGAAALPAAVTAAATTPAVAPAPAAARAAQPALADWQKMKAGETPANYDKRQQYTEDDIRAEAQQLVNGDKTLKDISGRDAGLLKHYAGAVAKEMDPNWSPADSDTRRQALLKWTNPDSQANKTVRSHITAANSIQDVKQAFDALQNGNTVLFNQIRNDFRANTGSELPISAKTGAMLLGPEIIKSIIPGGGGVTERLEAQHLMGVSLSPAQQAAVFKTLEDFQGNALKAAESSWTSAKLPKDQFRERMLGGSPAAQELYDKASLHQAQEAARRAGLAAAPDPAAVAAEMKRRGIK